MGVLIKKFNKIQVSGNFWPAVYILLLLLTVILIFIKKQKFICLISNYMLVAIFNKYWLVKKGQ